MLHPFSRTVFRLLGLLVLVALLFGSPLGAPLSSPVHAAFPDDTPVPVALGDVQEWTLGEDILWWSNNCFAQEFATHANLNRQIIFGGDPGRTVVAIDDGTRCNTFRAFRGPVPHTQIDCPSHTTECLGQQYGLYYMDESRSQIERMPQNALFTPQTVISLTTSQVPSRPFVAAGDFLYWASFSDHKIYRVLRDGSGPLETVANTGVSPVDVMVTGFTVYWTESSGVWLTGTNCATLPCSESAEQVRRFWRRRQWLWLDLSAHHRQIRTDRLPHLLGAARPKRRPQRLRNSLPRVQ